MTWIRADGGISRRAVLAGAGGAALGLSVIPEPAVAADAYADLRDRWCDSTTGASRIDPALPEFVAAIDRQDRSVDTYRNLIDRGTSRTKVFTDLELTQTSNSGLISSTYTRLRLLAMAWYTPGSRHYNNAAVLADLLAGLDTANRKVYNSGRAEFDNWWDWEIGSSRPLADCLLLLDGVLPTADRDRYAAAIQHFVPDPFYMYIDSRKQPSTGANRVDLCQAALIQGIASRSSTRIQRAASGLPSVCAYVSTGDGLYADGSFIQHSNVAYTGTYGEVLLTGMAKLLALLTGSAWQINDPLVQNLIGCVELAWAPVIHDGRMMSFVNGRAISREASTEQVLGHAAIADILRLAPAADPATAARWRAMCRGWFDRCTGRGPYDGADVSRTALVSALLRDPSVSPAAEPVSSVVFRNMARAVHRRPGWAFAVSMCNDRIARYETMNGENLKGFHTGAGMTYLYDADNTQYSDHFWPTVDPYRLAGTTVDRKTIADGGGRTLSTAKWAGGPVLDGYSAVGMTVQGSTTTLKGKVSWFCFDELVMAMGAGIASTSGAHVETNVEHRNLHASGENALTVDGVEWLGEDSATWAAVRWAHLEGVAGYVFPYAGQLKAQRFARTGRYRDITTTGATTAITRRYLALWHDHGVNPTSGRYCYLVVPGATVERTAELAASSGVSLLTNTANIQAVRQGTTGLTMANFWTAGTVANITVNKVCGVIVRESGDTLKIGVAEPYRSGNVIRVSVTPASTGYQLVSKDTAVTVAAAGTTIVLDVSPGTFGRTWYATFTRSVGGAAQA